MAQANSKIFSSKVLTKKLALLRKRRKKIVFTNGCFDLLHIGHLSLLKQAKRLGDILIVALNTDSSVKRLKGDKRPIVPLKERLEMMSSLEGIDFVTFFAEKTPLKVIRMLKPDVLVKGGDYKNQVVVGADEVERNGGRVVIVPLVKGKSSTHLLTKIKNL